MTIIQHKKVDGCSSLIAKSKSYRVEGLCFTEAGPHGVRGKAADEFARLRADDILLSHKKVGLSEAKKG